MPPELRAQIFYVYSDDPSTRLLTMLQESCVNLQIMGLDPVHLCIVFEYATWRKRTEGSSFLRLVMAKFNKHDTRTDCVCVCFREPSEHAYQHPSSSL